VSSRVPEVSALAPIPITESDARTVHLLTDFRLQGYSWEPNANHDVPPHTYPIANVDLDFSGLDIGTVPITVWITGVSSTVLGETPPDPGTQNADANSLVFVDTLQERYTDPADFDNQRRWTLIHELVHSFGLEDLCGLPDATGAYSCAMNYEDPIMRFDGTFAQTPKTPDGMNALCAQHILAIRESPGYGGEVRP